VCKELGLTIGRCNDDAKAILKQEGVEDPTKEQLMGGTRPCQGGLTCHYIPKQN